MKQKWEKVFFKNLDTYIEIINSYLTKEFNPQPLSDYIKIIGGYAFKSSSYRKSGIPIIRISDFSDEKINLRNVKYYDESPDLDRYQLFPGDIIIALTGGTIGKLAIVQDGLGKIYLNQRVGRFEILNKEKFDKRYIYWLARGVQARIKEIAWGGAQPNVSPRQIEKMEFPIPDINTQKNIVNFLENLKVNKQTKKIYFNENCEKLIYSLQHKSIKIDWLITELNHQHTLLTHLCQAILQEAVEGKLTAEWRRQHPELISGEHHAARLLEKIKAEKEKLAKNTKGTKKTKELPPVSDEEKPFDLPEGWVWCRLGDLADNIHYGYTASANYNINVPKFIRITDIQDNKVVWEKVPGCKISKSNILKYELNPRDILIARTGGTIGKTFLVKTLPYKSVFASYLIRLIPNDLICVEYLKNFMESPLYWLQLHKMSWGGGQPNVNATNLNKMLFPLPNFTEQHAIVEKVDRLLALVDALEQQVQERKTHAEQLMQAVLREAFERDTSVNKVEYKSVESK